MTTKTASSDKPSNNEETKIINKISFNKPSSFIPSFVGKAPTDINPEATKENIQAYKIEEILDRPIGIHGYIQLQGEYKGKDKPYIIMTCTSLEHTDIPFTVISGNSVIMKKMVQIGSNDGFPVAGTIVKVQGTANEYYDLKD
jgi:hypothetical protein